MGGPHLPARALRLTPAEVIRAAPDAGIFIAIAIGIAILWGTTRTILLLRNPRPALRDNLGDATKLTIKHPH